MTRLRFGDSASLALLMALVISQTTIAQTRSRMIDRPLQYSHPDSADWSYKIYSLNDFGNDPGFCEWIAQTIPELIAAGTWQEPGMLRYYAPKNVLVVRHTSAVQTQVDTFLKDLKKSLPEGTKAKAAAAKGPTMDPEVVPTVYRTSGLRKHGKLTSESSQSYPVPAPAKAPKHLFHFIIRYEGEGIIDDSVVKALKDYYRAEMKAGQTVPTAKSSCPPPGVAAPVSVSSEASLATPTPPYEKEKEDKKENKDTEKEKQVR